MLEQLKEDHVLWFLNRGSGVVLVAVLTVATALGVVATVRSGSVRWPRFATQSLHRSVSLLATVLVVVHAGTAVLDTYVSGFVTITPLDALVPFTSSYQRLWLGVGTLALDLMLAVVVTSLVRHRLGHGTWRLVHLLAYLSWGLGVLHGWMIGTDSRTWWGCAVTVASVGIVGAAAVVRVATALQERRLERLSGV